MENTRLEIKEIIVVNKGKSKKGNDIYYISVLGHQIFISEYEYLGIVAKFGIKENA